MGDARASAADHNLAIVDDRESGPAGKPREGVTIRTRHPGLQAQIDDFLEQRRPPQIVEVGRDFIEQQDRRAALETLAQHLRVRQDEAGEERFLLAG